MRRPEGIPAAWRIADRPRVLWIELTSKCPFRCVFCSREFLRGSGEHMDYAVYESLIRQTIDPQIVRLNYSGESIHYPQLLPAIETAAATGAFVELVSAFAACSADNVDALAASELDRLTVSLHTLDPEQFKRLYGYSTVDALRGNIARFRECRARNGREKPILDFAFVAMNENLPQFEAIAAYAAETGAAGVHVHPIIRRDPIPAQFPVELEGAHLRPEFRDALRHTVQEVRRKFPHVPVDLSTPELEATQSLDRTPRRYPAALPQEARIFTCEQNPFETVHVLANGDVVACEVLDKVPLGNLKQSSLREIWHGDAYRQFRARYEAGEVPECRTCPYKSAYLPSGLRTSIGPGSSGIQLFRGWHEPEGKWIWSQSRSAAMLPSTTLFGIRLRGLLPAAAGGGAKTLTIRCDGTPAGKVVNAGPETMLFDTTIPMAGGSAPLVKLEFETAPAGGNGHDVRDLGFALISLEAERMPAWVHLRSRLRLLPLELALRLRGAAARLGARFPMRAGPQPRWSPGIDVLIPERGLPDLLRRCLASLSRAAASLDEPCHPIIVVDGADRSLYLDLEREYPQASWVFHRSPLAFAQAVRMGLKRCRHDWVYLLNSDVTLDPAALHNVARWRAPEVFAIASQIFFADRARRREETGFTGFRTNERGCEIFDREPDPDGVVTGHLYAGGGASLFRRELLRSVMAAVDPYGPFYWEDVEWGLRAWRRGYEVLFAPHSRVEHVHRATISRHYDAADVERIFNRNSLQFSLRNGLPAIHTADALARIRMADPATRRESSSAVRALSLAGAALRNGSAPHAGVELNALTGKYYLRPYSTKPDRPTVLVVSPYAVYPSAHGGARRIAALLRHLQDRFRIVLLSDEGAAALRSVISMVRGPDAIHTVSGRIERAGAGRAARMRAHCHQALRREFERLIAVYSPDLVQLEFVELAALIEMRRNPAPWVLTLHDVPFGDAAGEDEAGERSLIGRFDAVIACSPEDAALLQHPRTCVVANGADVDPGSYRASSGRRLLFAGPFRYAPNLDGIVRFLERVYPQLLREVPGVTLDILGGDGAPERAARIDCFRQPGVTVHAQQNGMRAWLDGCALTLNPLLDIRGSSVKLAESVAAGRICISTRDGARGFLDRGLSSLIAAPSVEDFGVPLVRLLLNESERHALERPAVESESKLDWRSSADAQAALYESLLGTR